MPVFVGDEPRGWISIGMRPVGVVAIGLQPTGVIALGLLPIGAVSIGVVALGLISLGGVAGGLATIGTITTGWLSIGNRLALGWYALAVAHPKSTSIGAYAWGNRARGLLFEKGSWKVPAPVRRSERRSPISRRHQDDLSRFARRLDGTDALRLRRCVFWIGLAACTVAVAVSPLALWHSLASAEVLGWPLIAVGDYEFVGGPAVFVGEEPHGWISIGYRPTGFVAIGMAPTGVIALGAVSQGVVAVGLVAFGVLPLGFAAAGLVSYGVVSFGWISFGRASLGWFAHGEVTIGAYAWGNQVRGWLFERRLRGAQLVSVRQTGRNDGHEQQGQ